MSGSTAGAAGTGAPFPTTRWTVIATASSPDAPGYRRSLEELARLYWRPVYAYFRRKWGQDAPDAADLTQTFFAALLEKNFLRHLSPEKGRFRAYVMTALDNFVRLDYRSQSRLKRGGGVAHFPIEAAADFEPAPHRSPEEAFLHEWAHAILAEAIEELREEYRAAGQEIGFKVFACHDLETPPGRPTSYEELAGRFGVPVSTVTNTLYRARQKLRELVLRRVRDTVSSEAEAQAELLELFDKRLA